MLKKYYRKNTVEAGIDEAGRGCLAGPVVAAAVILPPRFRSKTLNDSKLLLPEQRDELRLIIEKKALAWSVAFVDNKRIDEVNILNATLEAMHAAVAGLKLLPGLLLVDGNYFREYPNIKHQCIIKGDASYYSIAAASVLAKTHRDEYMSNLHNEFPDYLWHKNKGYGTPEHRDAIVKVGYTSYHRRSFKINGQYSLEFMEIQ